MATYSVNWSALLASSSGTIAVGTCLVQDSDGRYVAGTTANRASYGRCSGIAATAGDSSNPAVTLIETGPVSATITGLAAGTESWVRVSSAGVLERVTPGAGDDIIGKAKTDGSVHLVPGVWDSTNYTSAAGSFTAGGDLTGTSSSQTVAKVNGATVPASGALTTGNAAYVTGVAALTYSALNIAGGAGYITGTLPVANGGTGIASIAAGVATFLGTSSSANLAAAVTDETGTGALVFGTAPLFKTTINLNNPADTFKYVITPAAIAADRILTLPLLTSGDTVAVLDFAQTLTNKTISGASNTITNVAIATGVSGLGASVATALATFSSANIATACTDETGSGALVFGTSPTISGPTISGTPIFSATSISATGNARSRAYSDIANVQTTDATVTSLFTWTILDEATTCCTAEVGACLSTAATSAAYVRRLRLRRDGGTVAVGTIETTFTEEDTAGWDCTIDNSTSTGRVRVTGAGGSTVDWGGLVSRLEVSHA